MSEQALMYPNLKLQIFKRGIRQNQLSRELGICESILSKIINGYRAPSPAERRSLAAYLEVEEEWLFERHEVAPVLKAFSLAARGGKNGQP